MGICPAPYLQFGSSMEANTSTASDINTFELNRRVTIDALNLDVEEYRHPGTGAVHLHLASDNPENVFMVALRTVPEDSSGVAHILEHTVLCGSERYPVRDPFFMMLRRSLNTFMNAFTSSDWTAYPFATQNRKDFDNLLAVYLDAVFFSRLDPLDFAQEGHRVEFATPDDADQSEEQLVFKGVVYNEMKGAMSSTSSVLWDKLCYELFPTNTYHYNSGGDPEVIPNLSYQQLRDFYASHYHPSNAIFLTFGDIPAYEHQTTFERLALQRFDRLDERIEVALEKPFAAPRIAQHSYAIDTGEDANQKTHHILGWKLGESADLTAMLEAQLVSAVLMENSASPLMQWLETTDLGTAPSPLCGVEESMREMVLCCGIEGSEPGAAQQFETAVLGVIERVAKDGVAKDKLESILHQIELHQREVTGDGMPYGLSLMLRALSAATHHGDAVAALDLDPVLADIRTRIEDPRYIPSLLHSLLLDNPHRVRLTVVPDTELAEQRNRAERARLDQLSESMDAEQRAQVIDLAEKLRERQQQQDDPSILPRVEMSDIPALLPEPKPTVQHTGHIHSYQYAAGTNGLVYQQWLAPLPALSDAEFERLPLLTGLISEVGAGSSDYLAMQDRHSAAVGSLGAATLTRSARDDIQSCSGWFLLSSKALANRIAAQIDLMQETFTAARFDEANRIRELVSQTRARRDQSITGNGHMLAMTAATAGMNPLAKRSHEQGGLEGIRRLRALDTSLANASELDRLLSDLTQLHGKLTATAGFTAATIADQDSLEQAYTTSINALSALTSTADMGIWSPTAVREARREYWITNTQVNFCAMAFPTVGSGHNDAPLLTVLAAMLRNGFLHRAVREQGGAYGGGASHDANIGAFRFFSYRDPRLQGTLDDFHSSIRWFIDNDHSQLALEEAVLGVIGSMDKPGSPAGEAKKHFHEQLFGRTQTHRSVFRTGVINATLDDLKRVASNYLLTPNPSIAVITNAETVKRNQTYLDELDLKGEELL